MFSLSDEFKTGSNKTPVFFDQRNYISNSSDCNKRKKLFNKIFFIKFFKQRTGQFKCNTNTGKTIQTFNCI